MVNLSINGFGRIGRIAFRIWLARDDLQRKLDIVAINTSGSMPTKGWAHLLKYDTAYGVLTEKVDYQEINPPEKTTDTDPLIGYLLVNQKKIAILAQKDPAKIPWKKYAVDLVIESTGKFRTEAEASLHLQAGAKKVLLSAPGKGDSIKTHVLGVNSYNGKDKIADNASCTTNCVAPVAAVLHEKIGVLKAALTTVHAYTDDQNLQDNSHKDLRRARAASLNIIPTSTGAAVAVTKIIPPLQDLFDGISLRVPVVTGSISDLTFLMKRPTTIEEVNNTLTTASQTPHWQGILAVTAEPIVSSDIIGRPESSIVDLSFTQVIGGDLVKILAWYDNEWGYANRLLEQAVIMGS